MNFLTLREQGLFKNHHFSVGKIFSDFAPCPSQRGKSAKMRTGVQLLRTRGPVHHVSNSSARVICVDLLYRIQE